MRPFFILLFSVSLAALLAYGGNVYIERVNDWREREALSDAMQLGIAVEEYVQDHKENYPIWMFYESVSRTPSASDDLDHWSDPNRDGGHLFAVVYGDGHCYTHASQNGNKV